MKKIWTVVAFGLLLAGMMFASSTALAQNEPNSPSGINDFSINPEEVNEGSTFPVEFRMNVDITSADGDTFFCFYAPAGFNAPAAINFEYYSGFTSSTATFNETVQGGANPTCPTRPNPSVLYGATGLPVGAITYEGSFEQNVSGLAMDLYDFTVLLQEATSTPNILTQSLTVLGPSAVTLSGANAGAGTTPYLPLAVAMMALFTMSGAAVWNAKRNS